VLSFFQLLADQPLAEINNSSTNQKECAMKKLFLTLVIFSVLVIIGCQENSITDPAQKDLQKDDNPLVHQGTMKLEGDLADPRILVTDGNRFLAIFGAVKFEHRIEYLENIPETPQPKIYLQLSMNAELQDRNSPQDVIWSISGESQDIINVSDNIDSNYILYKYYVVQGSDAGMRLVCRFSVTTSGVRLSDYWLELQSTDDSDQK
jgi:hypothetical protein